MAAKLIDDARAVAPQKSGFDQAVMGRLEEDYSSGCCQPPKARRWLVFDQAEEDRAYVRAICGVTRALFEELQRFNEGHKFPKTEITSIEIVEAT